MIIFTSAHLGVAFSSLRNFRSSCGREVATFFHAQSPPEGAFQSGRHGSALPVSVECPAAALKFVQRPSRTVSSYPSEPSATLLMAVVIILQQSSRLGFAILSLHVYVVATSSLLQSFQVKSWRVPVLSVVENGESYMHFHHD